MKQTGKKRMETMDIAALILMTLITLCILIPFWNSIIISFSTVSAYLRNPFAFWPLEGTLENYTVVLKTGVIFTSYKNTILITVTGTILSMSGSGGGQILEIDFDSGQVKKFSASMAPITPLED